MKTGHKKGTMTESQRFGRITTECSEGEDDRQLWKKKGMLPSHYGYFRLKQRGRDSKEIGSPG